MINSVSQVLKATKKRRSDAHPYKFTPGKFQTSTSFRDKKISVQECGLAWQCAKHLSMRELAYVLRSSAAVVSKMVRIYETYLRSRK